MAQRFPCLEGFFAVAMTKPMPRASEAAPRKTRHWASRARQRALAEYSMVRARCLITEGGESVPAGARGAIVHVVKRKIGPINCVVGYVVEFVSPRHVVISARRSQLTPA